MFRNTKERKKENHVIEGTAIDDRANRLVNGWGKPAKCHCHCHISLSLSKSSLSRFVNVSFCVRVCVWYMGVVRFWLGICRCPRFGFGGCWCIRYPTLCLWFFLASQTEHRHQGPHHIYFLHLPLTTWIFCD